MELKENEVIQHVQPDRLTRVDEPKSASVANGSRTKAPPRTISA